MRATWRVPARWRAASVVRPSCDDHLLLQAAAAANPEPEWCRAPGFGGRQRLGKGVAAMPLDDPMDPASLAPCCFASSHGLWKSKSISASAIFHAIDAAFRRFQRVHLPARARPRHRREMPAKAPDKRLISTRVRLGPAASLLACHSHVVPSRLVCACAASPVLVCS